MNSIVKLLRGFKRSWLLSICLCLALIIALSMMLSKHLLEVQIEERLSKASREKETLVFTYLASEDNKKVFLFDDDEYHYYFYGIDEGFISYGSTSTTFKDAILKDYITIESLLSECIKKDSKENVNYYVHSGSKEEDNYRIAVETRKDEDSENADFYITIYPYNLNLDDSLMNDSSDIPQKKC